MLMANDSTIIAIATRVTAIEMLMIIIITTVEDRAIRVRDWAQTFRVRNE
jgi:hypothetical protein